MPKYVFCRDFPPTKYREGDTIDTSNSFPSHFGPSLDVYNVFAQIAILLELGVIKDEREDVCSKCGKQTNQTTNVVHEGHYAKYVYMCLECQEKRKPHHCNICCDNEEHDHGNSDLTKCPVTKDYLKKATRKKPWQPEEGETVWFIDLNEDLYNATVSSFSWGDITNENRLFLGVYRTREEAEAARDRIKEFVRGLQ